MSIRRPEDFTHFEQQLPGVKLHYVREGSGPPLVLMHGWPGFWYEWHKVIGPLAEHYDVIVPDHRGYGDSEKPDLGDISLYTLEQAIDDIDALLGALGIEQAYVVGHDWAALMMHGAFAPPLLSDEEMEIYVDTFMKPGNVQGGFNWYRANLSVTSAPFNQLDQTLSDVPITFLWGMGDKVVPPDVSPHIPLYYTNFTMEYVPDAGHYMMVEKPDVVIDRIRKHFV